jgi:hypothetical protein
VLRAGGTAKRIARWVAVPLRYAAVCRVEGAGNYGRLGFFGCFTRAVSQPGIYMRFWVCTKL